MEMIDILNIVKKLRELPPKNQTLKELLSELEFCNEEDQKQKILEMIALIEDMNKEEFRYVFTKELFNRINQMIEEKIISLKYSLLVLKSIGYSKSLMNMWGRSFERSLLRKRFEEMIAEEDEKKEEKNEKQLTDLCECYIFLSYNFPPSLLSFCVRCLIKVALNKEENEEAQKEVEMALLALSHIDGYYKIEKELYLNEIKEIIQYHQEHRNLTQLAYQSAWQFLLRRLEMDIANELHLAREAARELEELSKCLDWKRKEEKKGKETKEEKIINRWLQALFNFLCYCNMWNEEFIGLIGSIVEVYRAAKDNYRNICERCIIFLRKAAICESVKTDYLVKGGATNVALEEIQQPTTDDRMIHESLSFFVAIPLRMKEEKEDGIDEAKRKKNKIKLFEKLEEEGYEDSIASFHEIIPFHFINTSFFKRVAEYISDFFVGI